MTKEEIAKILKDLRINSGKTQQQVADLIGRKQQVVGHWETGYAQPDADTLFKLCEMYGTTVDDAFGFVKTGTSKYEILTSEYEIIEKYRVLDQRGKDAVLETLEREYSYVAADAAKQISGTA